MLYEITQDCRIANKEYKKGDIVTVAEVGQYFTTVMKPIYDAAKATKEPVKGEKNEEPKATTEIEDGAKAEIEEAKEEPKEVSKKAPKKKK